MPVTRIKTNQITDSAVTTAKIADSNVTAGKLADDLTYGSNLTISGNLTVNGTTTTVDTTNTTIQDPFMLLGSAGAGNVDGGIIINRGSAGNNAAVIWDESADEFATILTTDAGTTAGNVTIASYADLKSGSIEATNLDAIIGANTPAAITGTTITANTKFVGAIDGIVGGNTPAAVTGTTITANTGFSGPLDGIIGGTTPAAVTGTTITANTSFAGALNGTVGATTPASGAFTDLTANGTITMSSNAITNVSDPSNAQDAATKAYVDAQVSGSQTKIFAGDSNVELSDSGSDGAITFNIDGSSEGTINSNGLTIGNINVDGNTIKTTSGDLTIDPANPGVTGTVTIAGNLTVTGTTTTVDSTVVTIADPVFQIGADSNDSLDRGIKFLHNDGSSKGGFFGMDESADEFVYIPDATDSSSVFTGSLGSAAFGSLRVTDLTANRIVFVGANGELQDDSDLTFDGTTLTGAFSGTFTAAAGTTTTIGSGQTLDVDGVVDIDASSGDISGATIGATTPAAVTGTTITANTGFVGPIDGIVGGSTPAAVTGTTITANTKFVGPIDGIVGGNTPAAITGTTITANTAIDGALGVNTPAAATVTTLTGNSNATIAGTLTVGGTGTVTGAQLVVDSTDSLKLPVGTTAQRPETPVAGMYRFNSTTGALEVYTGGEWNAGADFTTITADAFNGDDTTTAFTLSVTGTTATTIVALNGVVQIPTTAYAVSGTTLTFTEAPATGDVIDARVLTTTSTIVSIADQDGDTQIQVEEGSDDDTIRFDAAGSEMFTINSTGFAGASGARITTILDEDGMGSNSATALVTQQSIKAYVDAQVTASDLDFQGDSGGALSIDLDSETLDIAGGTGIDTAGSGNTLTVAIDSTVATLTGSQTLTNKTLTAPAINGVVGGTATSQTITTLTTNGIFDADADTSVTVEDSSDVDEVKFNAAGNYVACVKSSGVDIKGNYTFTLGGIMDANAKRLTNLATPTNSGDAATKGYVDGELAGLSQNSISAGDSTFAIADSGTGAATLTLDNATHTTFNSSGITLATGVFSGTATSAQYADLAEMYTADADIEPGTVVCFGGDKEVTTCMLEADKKVAGVVSTNPAYLMNSDAEGAVAVALQGRVPCKVKGPVAKGDMMVSAGDGSAKASADPKLGEVIGKALEDFDGEEGVIEVVVGRM